MPHKTCHSIKGSLSRDFGVLGQFCAKKSLFGTLKADLHGTTLSYAINLRQVYDMNRFV